MAYRKNKHRVERWTQWRSRYADALLALPLPMVFSSSENHWVHFLEHGSHPHDPSHFHLEQLTAPETAALRTFLEAQDAAGEYTGMVLAWLRHHDQS